MSTKDTRTKVLTFDQVRQVLQALPNYLLPEGTREWIEQSSDVATPETSGNWVLYFKSGGLFLRDDAGTVTGPLVDAASSGGLTSAYTSMTDGTTTASASGSDTFKFRTGNSILTVVVTSNDGTHGDNALFTIVQSAIDHGSIGGLSDQGDHPDYLTRDATRALTANWDAGSFEIRAQTLQSDQATGTAPLIIASTTVVANLNTSLLEGNAASAFALASHTHTASQITDFETEKEKRNYVTVTANYTVLVTDDVVFIDAKDNDITVTLPDVSTSDGKDFDLKRKDQSGNTVTVVPS